MLFRHYSQGSPGVFQPLLLAFGSAQCSLSVSTGSPRSVSCFEGVGIVHRDIKSATKRLEIGGIKIFAKTP